MYIQTLTLMLLLSGCGSLAVSGSDVFCDLPTPTVSANDTPQTIIEVDNFLAKRKAVCDAN